LRDESRGWIVEGGGWRVEGSPLALVSGGRRSCISISRPRLAACWLAGGDRYSLGIKIKIEIDIDEMGCQNLEILTDLL
jgi:hypothetical protein